MRPIYGDQQVLPAAEAFMASDNLDAIWVYDDGGVVFCGPWRKISERFAFFQEGTTEYLVLLERET